MAASRQAGSPRFGVEARLARAARRVVAWEGARRTRIELTLLDPVGMRRLNRRVTGRRGLTDVLAFALPQPDGTLVGDVYVCPAAARRWVRAQAGRAAAADVVVELLRLAVHGTLHILGYDHPEGASRTRSPMWQKQERYLRRLLASRP